MSMVWRDLSAASLRGVPPAWRAWLTWRGSMTQALTWDGVRPTVRLGRQTTHGQVWPDEAALLGRRAGPGWVREVSLHHGERTLLLARTVALAPALRHAPRLRQLGTRPLGELLFEDGMRPRVGARQVARLAPHSRTLRALRPAGTPPPYPSCWARRTVYWLEQSPLLVTEIFVPGWGGASPVRRQHAPAVAARSQRAAGRVSAA